MTTASRERAAEPALSRGGADRGDGARLVALPALVVRDAVQVRLARLLGPRDVVAADALDDAIDWLCRTHDVTGRRGSAKGFSLLRGWLAAYPETSGYVIGTLVEFASRRSRADLVERALELGDWEAEVQLADGGVIEGTVDAPRRRPIVFNTGMVLHGFIDLERAGHAGYREPATRAARFLIDHLRADGTWDGDVEYSGLAHAYNARVAWALLRFADAYSDDEVGVAARRQLDWALSVQHPNGWFDRCAFKLGTDPSTHAIAYTLRGLLESHHFTGDDRYLAAVETTSEVLIRKHEVLGYLPSTWDRDWNATARHMCLTGTAQLGGVWLRLYQVCGDARYLNAGLKAVEQAASRQERSRWPPVKGALAGSFPIWGRYAPLQYPNWATKFLADSLMLREDCLAALA